MNTSRVPMTLLAALVLAATAAVPTSRANAEELTIGMALDSPPYVIDKATRGIEVDIIRKALAYRGHTFKPKQFSYKQLDDVVTKMGLDAAATVIEKSDGTHYSAQYITFHNYAYTRATDQITINSVKDLKGRSIVAWENAYLDLGKTYEALFAPKVRAKGYREIGDQAVQVTMFWNGKADVIVIDEAIMLWFTKHQEKSVSTSAELTRHQIFTPNTDFRISFKSAKLRDDFDAGLKHLKKTGEYKKIYDSFLK